MKMAGKKDWRDAATLILTANSNNVTCSVGASKKSETSPLANINIYSSMFNYSVLMLKRSSKSKFMPNAYVFPGGVLSSSDSSSGWENLFKQFGHNKDDIEELVLKNVDRPLLMTSSDVNEAIVRDIALRLTAIRETFEESGILLHKNTQTNGAYNFTDKEFLSDWRGKVHKSPEEFLKLYKLLETVPDIWSLTEWSDWLTPTDLHEQGRRRFDTIFYQTSLQTIPTTLLDQQEVTAVQCQTLPQSSSSSTTRNSGLLLLRCMNCQNC